MSTVARVSFTTYDESMAAALDRIGAPDLLPAEGLIVVKPNLTNADAPPVTTDVRAAAAVGSYCRRHTDAEVAIGEGSGTGDTWDTYRANGYDELAEELGLRLIDFDCEDSVELARDDALQLQTFHLPRLLVHAFVISLPVLKDHSMTTTTVALKNMFGIAPARHYGGAFNKSQLHSPSTHKSVVDVCLYKAPDLSVVDASLGLKGGHLWGTPTEFGVVLASRDPVAVDAVGSRLLGHDPHGIEYLRLANGRLGALEDIDVV